MPWGSATARPAYWLDALSFQPVSEIACVDEAGLRRIGDQPAGIKACRSLPLAQRVRVQGAIAQARGGDHKVGLVGLHVVGVALAVAVAVDPVGVDELPRGERAGRAAAEHHDVASRLGGEGVAYEQVVVDGRLGRHPPVVSADADARPVVGQHRVVGDEVAGADGDRDADAVPDRAVVARAGDDVVVDPVVVGVELDLDALLEVVGDAVAVDLVVVGVLVEPDAGAFVVGVGVEAERRARGAGDLATAAV